MLNCKEVSQLVSNSLDEKLPLNQSLQVKLHLAMCAKCKSFDSNMRELKKMTEKMKQ